MIGGGDGVAHGGEPGQPPRSDQHRAGAAGDRHAVDIDGLAGGGGREQQRAIEADGPRLDIEQRNPAVGIDRHVVVGARHGPDPNLLGDAGQDLVALIEIVGNVGALPRALDYLVVERLELGEQRVDVVDGAGDIGVRLPAQLLHGPRCAIERLREIAGSGDRGAGSGRILRGCGIGLDGVGELAHQCRRRGVELWIVDGLIELIERVDDHLLCAGIGGSPQQLLVEGCVGSTCDGFELDAATGQRDEICDLARRTGIAGPRNVAGHDRRLIRRDGQPRQRRIETDRERHAGSPVMCSRCGDPHRFRLTRTSISSAPV